MCVFLLSLFDKFAAIKFIIKIKDLYRIDRYTLQIQPIEKKFTMKKGPVAFVIASIAITGLLFGCSTTASEKIAKPDRQVDRYFQRMVTDYQGRPILRITGEYRGKQPYAGYDTAVPWKTIDTDFYNIEFENLTSNKIAFISKKVYQRNAQPVSAERGDPVPVLTEFADFTREQDPDFESLEPHEDRKLINWAVHTNNQLSDDVATIVFRIRHMKHEYTFNIFLAYHK
jgi:hypothetical protein